MKDYFHSIKNDGPPKRAVFYMRVSSKGQSDNYSLPAQLEILQKWCEEKGYVHIKTYEDVMSGKDIESREHFMEMIEDAKHKMFDVIMTLDNDRFTRNMKEGLIIIDDLLKYDIYIMFYNLQHIDIYSDEGRMMLADHLKYSEFFRGKLKVKIRIGVNRKRKEGQWVGAAPYGFKVISTPVGMNQKNTQLEIIPTEIEYIKIIFEMSKDGMSLSEIGERLTAERIRPKRGQKWYPSTINSILSRREWYKKMGVEIDEI